MDLKCLYLFGKIKHNSLKEKYQVLHLMYCMIIKTCLYLLFYSRPRSVDDVAYQDEVVAVLKKSLEGSDVSSSKAEIFKI